MKIPKEIRKEWAKKRAHGDGKAISADSGISEVTISRALLTGIMSEKTFNAIATYYKDKPVLKDKLIAIAV